MNITQKYNDFPSVYKSFGDIPADLRLETYESRFEDRDLLNEYISFNSNDKDWSDSYINRVKSVTDSWREICDEMDCHPALASPDVIKAWCERLLERYRKTTVYKRYLCRINRFYRYLMWHVDYPHTYNPVLFAAREFITVNQVWYDHSKGDGDD